MKQELTTADLGAAITSLALMDLVNEARAEAGEPLIENRHFVARVEDELAGELLGVKILRREGSRGADQRYYDLTADQALLVGMRESKAVRRRVLKRLRRTEKALVEQLERQVEHHKALAIEARDQFLERATQAEQLYRELHDKRSVEVPTSAGRFNILDVFQDHRVEQGKDGALLIHGYVTGIEQEVTVRCHRGRWFMDQLVLCEVFGLSPLQTKKLTTQADRCVVDGRLLLDLRCMPKPLTNLVM